MTQNVTGISAHHSISSSARSQIVPQSWAASNPLAGTFRRVLFVAHDLADAAG